MNRLAGAGAILNCLPAPGPAVGDTAAAQGQRACARQTGRRRTARVSPVTAPVPGGHRNGGTRE